MLQCTTMLTLNTHRKSVSTRNRKVSGGITVYVAFSTVFQQCLQCITKIRASSIKPEFWGITLRRFPRYSKIYAVWGISGLLIALSKSFCGYLSIYVYVCVLRNIVDTLGESKNCSHCNAIYSSLWHALIYHKCKPFLARSLCHTLLIAAFNDRHGCTLKPAFW